MIRAEPDSWKRKPMPADVIAVDYTADFTPAEFERISRGFIPRDMDDRWFAFLDGDTLNIHRSWTGICIFQIEFERDGQKYSVRRATANRAQFKCGQSYNAVDPAALHSLVRYLLVDRESDRREWFLISPDPRSGRSESACQRYVPEGRCPGENQKQKPWWKFWI
jgi:hypothetical protein